MLFRIVSFLGLFILIGLLWLMSNNRKKVSWKLVLWGIILQVVFALIVLKTAPGYAVFKFASDLIYGLIKFTDKGANFLLNKIYEGVEGINPQGHVYGLYNITTGQVEPVGIIFIFHVLLTIVFFASLMSVLYHLGIMQIIVQAIAKVMRKFMGTSGAETLCVSANIFVGQTEAPLVVRPYVKDMTMSELMAVMTSGFATMAGGVLIAYARFGIDPGHLLTASVISAPAALVAAKIMYPETEEPLTKGDVKVKFEKTTVNIFDAACTGAADGMRLVINVASMLLAFIAIISLIDYCLGWAHDQIYWLLGGIGKPEPRASLGLALGILFYPISLIMGAKPEDCLDIGQLLGIRMAINEFVAYYELSRIMDNIDPRSLLIAIYAFCGFANFSSIAIQIGGISGIAPERRQDLAKIGLRAMIAGTFASFLTACVVGFLLADDDIHIKQLEWRLNWLEKEAALGTPKYSFQKIISMYEDFKKKYPDSWFMDKANTTIKNLQEQADSKFQQLQADYKKAYEERDYKKAKDILLLIRDGIATDPAKNFAQEQLKELKQ